MLLDKYDIKITHATTKELKRPLLECVHFNNNRMEVADGYMLAMRELPLEKDEPKPQALVHASLLNKATFNKDQITRLTIKDNKVTISHQNDKGEPIEYNPTLTFNTYGDNGKVFPHVDALYKPLPTNKSAYVALKVSLLKKLLSCLPDEGILRLSIIDSKSPVEYHCTNMDRPISGIIMPMYVDWTDFKWHEIPPNNQDRGK